jgi:hypothetical protein
MTRASGWVTSTARKHAQGPLANAAEGLHEKNAPLEGALAAARQPRPTGRLRRRIAFSKTRRFSLAGLAADPALAIRIHGVGARR